MGFEELPHTADWSLRVWALDLPGLFIESAFGMNTLSGVLLSEGPRTHRTFEATSLDIENLLISFLSELIFAVENERLVFDKFEINLESINLRMESHLHVEMSGAPLVAIAKSIKAVTYHNLQILHTMRGYEVEIVFDV